jgi:hypothetical protein
MEMKSCPIKKFATLSMIAALVGCAAPPPATFSPLAFDEAEYAALPTSGTGIIRGQVFAKTVGGDIKKGAGENVVIFPATKYGTQRYQEQVLGGKLAASTPDSRYNKNVFVKTSDGDGKFEFNEIPPGQYYIFSQVTWSIFEPNQFGPIERVQGGRVAREIEVKNGGVTEAILNR